MPEIVVSKCVAFDSLGVNEEGQPVLTAEQVQFYQQHGYLVIKRFLPLQLVDKLCDRFAPLFRGDFDTGVYPDEWYGRPDMCSENMTKEICNAWKSDKLIASVVLSSIVHRVTAQLNGWKSSRIAQDDVLWKPALGGTPVGFHRDSTYISDQFTPRENNSVTVWMPMDDVTLESGTLEYVEQSHLWKWKNQVGAHVDGDASVVGISQESFHSSSNDNEKCHRHKLLHNSTIFDLEQKEHDAHFSFVEIPRGGVAFHHQDMIHGSGTNKSQSSQRKAVVLHALNGECLFNESRHPSYIYGRYKLMGEELHDKFFPICWSRVGEVDTESRSSWLCTHCDDLSESDMMI